MNRPIAIITLRWAVGLVVLVEALHFVLSPATAAHFARTGLLFWMRPVLGWVEPLAAILFLVPATRFAGASALLLTFAAAVTLHFHFGKLWSWSLNCLCSSGYCLHRPRETVRG